MKVNTKLTLHPCGLKSWLSPLGGTGPGRRLRFSPHCQWSALLTLVKFQGTREACCCGKPQFFLFCLHLGPSQPPRFIPEHLLIAPQSSVLASPYILVTTFWSPLWAFALAVYGLEISLTSPLSYCPAGIPHHWDVEIPTVDISAHSAEAICVVLGVPKVGLGGNSSSFVSFEGRQQHGFQELQT